MKNILFFSNYLVGGGAEKTILNLLDYINSNVQSVNAYYCACFHNEEIENKHNNIIILGNSCRQNDPIIIKAISKLKNIHELRKIKKNLNINTSISFLPGNDWINLFAGIGERKIASIRNTESLFIRSKLKRLFFHLVWNRYDKIVTISKAVEADLKENFSVSGDKVITIYNPSPQYKIQDDFSLLELEDCKRNGAFTIVTIGRLTKQKGQWHLIKAVKILKERYHINNLVVYILGKGELEAELLKLIDEYGLGQVIKMVGFVNNPQSYMYNCDLFVFPSLCEGLGNVLIEALSCNIPIISADCPHGPREILAPSTNYNHIAQQIEYAEYGILIPPFDLNDEIDNRKTNDNDELLAKAIYKVIEDEELRERYKSLCKIRAKDYSIEKITNEWMKYI